VGANGVLVQVCIQCGKEYMFDSDEPPTDLACDKCGSSVFRSFVAETGGGRGDDDFRASSTERDTLTTDPATDVTQGDLHDLGNVIMANPRFDGSGVALVTPFDEAGVNEPCWRSWSGFTTTRGPTHWSSAARRVRRQR
jgi:hypothetical protein